VEEVHGLGVGLLGGGAGDLVVAAPLLAVALDAADDIAGGAPAVAGLVPLHGDLVAGDKAAPAGVGAEVEERRAAGDPALPGQGLAGVGVEQEGNRGVGEVEVAVFTLPVTGHHLRHGVQLVQLLGAGKAQNVVLPALWLDQALGAVPGAYGGVGGVHPFEAFFQAGFGHIVEQ